MQTVPVRREGVDRCRPGVYGTSPSAVGVYGQGTQNAGVFGASPVYGVWGRTNTGFGLNGEATGRGIGVYGKAGADGRADEAGPARRALTAQRAPILESSHAA